MNRVEKSKIVDFNERKSELRPDVAEVESPKKPSKRNVEKYLYKVGSPLTVEHLASRIIGNDEVHVSEYRGRHLAKQLEAGEAAVLKGSERESLAKRGEAAEKATRLTLEERNTLERIIKLFNEKRETFVLIDPQTIDNGEISKEGLHFLVPRTESDSFKPILRELGFDLRELKKYGFTARKNRLTFSFLYPDERLERGAA